MPPVAAFFVVVGTAVGASAAAAAVVGGLVVAGTAMSVIGMVTGNKTLTKWGGIISLVGGVGALASGAASAASTSIASSAATSGTEAGAVSGMDLAADAAVGTGNNVATAGAGMTAGEAAAGTGEAVSGTYAGPEAMPTTAPPPIEEQPDLGLTSTKPTDAVATPVGAPAQPAQPPAPIMDTQYAQPATAAPNTTDYRGTTMPDSMRGGGMNAMPDATVQTSSQKFWENLKNGVVDFAKSPSGGKIIAGAVQGIGSGMSQQAALQKQFDLQQQAIEASRKRYSDSLNGLTVGVYKKGG